MIIIKERQRAEAEEQEPRPHRPPPRVGTIRRRRRHIEHSHNTHMYMHHHPCHPRVFHHPYPPDGRRSKIQTVVIYIIIIPGVGKVPGIIPCCVQIPPNTTPTAIPIPLHHRIRIVPITILGITMVGTGIVKIIPANGNHDPLG